MQTCVNLKAISTRHPLRTAQCLEAGKLTCVTQIATVLGQGIADWHVALGLQKQQMPFSYCAKFTFQR